MIPTLKLKSGAEIPVLGFGTWQLVGDKCIDAVKNAIDLGYTHIDTAEMYENEHYVREGINEKEVFVTSKISPNHLDRSSIYCSLISSLSRLNLRKNGLNLYLVHWPNKKISMKETFEALSDVAERDLIKGVGVSNFTIPHLKKAMANSRVPILVNQVECHVFFQQQEMIKFCKENNIIVTAYAPLAHGKAVTDPTLSAIGKKYGKTAAQVALRWCVEQGCVVIPKASSKERIKENMEIFDFKLDQEDLKSISNLPQQRIFNPPWGEFNQE